MCITTIVRKIGSSKVERLSRIYIAPKERMCFIIFLYGIVARDVAGHNILRSVFQFKTDSKALRTNLYSWVSFLCVESLLGRRQNGISESRLTFDIKRELFQVGHTVQRRRCVQSCNREIKGRVYGKRQK